MTTHSNIFTWKILGQMSSAGYSPWLAELDTTKVIYDACMNSLILIQRRPTNF